MFKMCRNKKAQNTAEYAILIALVVGGIVAMQTYAQRTMQARMRDASKLFATSTNELGSTEQYEPYYQNTSSDNDKISTKEDTAKMQSSNTETGKKQDTYKDDTTYNGIAGY